MIDCMSGKHAGHAARLLWDCSKVGSVALGECHLLALTLHFSTIQK
jgi:hypothetical protein